MANITDWKTRLTVKLGQFSGLTRFVLKIGDEGAALIKMTGKVVEDAWFVSSDAEEGPEGLRGFITAEPRAPVYVLMDVLEQMYREEELPQVGAFDRAKVLHRRLDMAFPNDELRAALLWKRKEPVGRSYLFSSLPLTDQMRMWQAFIESLPNPLPGYSLLPLESLDLIRHLIPPEMAATDHWRGLITQEASGGFRHIIEYHDRMVVTRLTMKPSEDNTPEDVAKLIEREYRSTIGYVKRMGYDERNPMDLVVITPDDVGYYLQQANLPARSLTVLEPQGAGDRTGLRGVGTPGLPYADILHAAWLGQKKKPRLTMMSAGMKRRVQMRSASQGAIAVAAAATLAVLGNAGMDQVNIMVAEQELGVHMAERDKAKLDFDRAKRELDQFPLSPSEMRAVIETYESQGKGLPHPIELLGTIGKALGESARLVEVNFDNTAAANAVKPGAPQAAVKKPAKADVQLYKINLKAEFSGIAEPDKAVAEAKALGQRLAEMMPAHKVQIARLPVAILPSQTLEGGLGSGPKADAKKDDKKQTFTADYEVIKEGGAK